jgi:hypothetical protein
MELIAIAVMFVLSVALGLVAARATLSALFVSIMRPATQRLPPRPRV